MSKPIDNFLEVFENAMQSDLAEGVGGNKSMRQNSTENLKRGFEIFLDYLDATNVKSMNEFSEAVTSFEKSYPMEKLFAEVMDMMRKGMKWATRDGKLSGPAGGPGLDSKFNTKGFEIFLKFAPESAKKFKGLPIDKKRLYLPEGSDFIGEEGSAQSTLIDPKVQDYYNQNSEELENLFEEYVLERDWGSGEDKINITDDMFWEFVDEKMSENTLAEVISDLSEALDGTETDEEIKILAENIDFEDLQNIIDVQGTDGNWNSNPYMHGLYNGLILARDVLKGVEPEYKDAPNKWLSDKEN